MQRHHTIALGLLLLALVAYEPVRHAGFVNLDDRIYVTQNPVVREGLTAGGLAWAWELGYAANWHPVTWLSHMLDVSLWGLDPAGHHATSLVLHALSVLLLFQVLRRATGATWRSAVATAAFAVHPVHVESVAWVSERKDVLCALFGILALGAWVSWTRAGGTWRRVAALLLFALGLAAKPMLVTFPFLLLLFDVWPLERLRRVPWRTLLAEKLPFLALSAVSCVLTLRAQSGAIADDEALPLLFRLANSACAYVEYLRQALWPRDLAVFYPYATHLSVSRSIACAAFLLGTTAVLALQVRARPWLLVGWLWWLGMLVPVIGLVQVGRQAMADRYMHLPIVGLAIAFVWGLGELAQRKAAARALAGAGAAVIVLGWTLLARAQAQTWQDDFALFGHAIEVTERNPLAHRLLGAAYAEKGRLDEGLEQYRLAVQANPHDPELRVDLALTLIRLGRYAEAEQELAVAIQRRPDLGEAHFMLGEALAQQGRLAEAIASVREGIRLLPEREDAKAVLETMLREQAEAERRPR